MSTITVKFKCNECDITVPVTVQSREPDEDILIWMKKVGQTCGERHLLISPTCPNRKVDLAIPLPKDAEFIGQENDMDEPPDSLFNKKDEHEHPEL